MGARTKWNNLHDYVYHYDLFRDTWVARESLPFACGRPACVFLSGFRGRPSIFCAKCGNNLDAVHNKVVLVYDILDNAWTPLAQEWDSPQERVD